MSRLCTYSEVSYRAEVSLAIAESIDTYVHVFNNNNILVHNVDVSLAPKNCGICLLLETKACL